MKEKVFSILKKELGISYFSGTGAGGQHRNRHMNCVRMFHKESDTKITCQDYREKNKNERGALKRLVGAKSFKNWVRKVVAMSEVDREKLNREVDKMMAPKNLKIETFIPS